MKIKNIAFIGLGNMGFYMAKHLVKNKYKIFPHDINKNNLKNFYNETKIKEENFIESVEKIDCAILMVPSSKEVNDIIFKSTKLSQKFTYLRNFDISIFKVRSFNNFGIFIHRSKFYHLKSCIIYAYSFSYKKN